MLEFELPWDSQPQEAVQFRADLAAELGFYAGFINPLTAWNNGVGYSPSGLEPTPTQAGLALSNTTGTAVGTYPFSGSPESSELTVIMHAVRFGAQPDSGFGTALYAPKLSGSQDSFDWFIKDAGERIRLNTTTVDASGQYWETTENWPVGTWQTAAFTWRSGSHPDLFRNGVKLSRSVTAPFSPGGVLKPSGPLSINLGALRLNGAVAAGLVFSKAWSDDQIAEYARDFQSLLQLVEPRSIWVPVSAGGGGTTINGSLGTAAASGLSGTVAANTVVTGSLGNATASGFTGTVSQNTTIAGALGVAAASGLSGTVAANTVVTGSLGVADALGLQGTVSQSVNTTINGSLGEASASGLTAGVNANHTISGALGNAQAVGLTGTVSNTNDIVINGALGIAVASGLVASVTADTIIAGALGEATAEGLAGSVASGDLRTISVVQPYITVYFWKRIS